MPDQAPPAPEGCVYGPWRDQWYWLCVAPWKSITGMVLASHMWDGKQWQRCTEACEPELLRLAQENQALKEKNKRLVDGLELVKKMEEVKDKQLSCVGRRGTKRGILIGKDQEAVEYQSLDIEAGEIEKQASAIIAEAKNKW